MLRASPINKTTTAKISIVLIAYPLYLFMYLDFTLNNLPTNTIIYKIAQKLTYAYMATSPIFIKVLSTNHLSKSKKNFIVSDVALLTIWRSGLSIYWFRNIAFLKKYYTQTSLITVPQKFISTNLLKRIIKELPKLRILLTLHNNRVKPRK